MFKTVYGVFDFYENQFGEQIFESTDFKEIEKFCKEYIEECDGECRLKILKKEVRI